jgi:hypothetical protein
MNIKTYLEELRTAAREQTQDVEPLMKILIKSLESCDALTVALKQVSSFLPTFENNHPDITWPRQWLEAASKFKPIEYEKYSFGFFDDEVSDISSKAFVSALGILNSGFRAYYENREDTAKKLAASAIAHIISAEILHYWIVNFPKSWEVHEQTYQEGIVDEKGFEPVREYKASPQRQAYERELWLALADEVEAISQK